MKIYVPLVKSLKFTFINYNWIFTLKSTFFKDYETYFKKQKDEQIISELSFLKRTKTYDARWNSFPNHIVKFTFLLYIKNFFFFRKIDSTIDNWLAKAKQRPYKVEINKTDFDVSNRVSAFTVYIPLFILVKLL